MILSAKIMIIFDSAKKNRIYFHKAYVKSRTGLLPLSVTRKTISLGGLRTGGQSAVRLTHRGTDLGMTAAMTQNLSQ
jgi:hypothetical protein